MPTMSAAFATLAHQGGWDEILLVGGPIVVIIAVLAIAKHRVDKLHQADETSQELGQNS